jgi:RNA polymerase sigma-70 factor, ECF subfamily
MNLLFLTFPMSLRALTPSEVLRACIDNGTEEAWVLFVRTFQPIIVSSISRVVSRCGDTNPALIDDLTQETFLRLCKDDARILRQFEVRHETAIFGYIKVIATSVALDHFRARTAQKRATEVQVDDVHIESASQSTKIEQAAVLEEVDRRLAVTESERDRTIFWLYYRQGYSTREIAAMSHFGLTQKGIESCIHRMTGALRGFLIGGGSKFAETVEGKPMQSAFGEVK